MFNPQDVKSVQREIDRLYACSRLFPLLTIRERKIARGRGLSVVEILRRSSPERSILLGFAPETPQEVTRLLITQGFEGPGPEWRERALKAVEAMEGTYGERITGREAGEIRRVREVLARKVCSV